MVPTPTQWMKLNEYVLQVTTIHRPDDFCKAALDLLPKLVAFEQGTIFYLDEQGELYDMYTTGFGKRFSLGYLKHEFTDEEGPFSIVDRAKKFGGETVADARKKEHVGRVPINPIIATDYSDADKSSKFYRDYVRARGIKHSTGFGMFDNKGRIRIVIALDRTSDRPFSRDERIILSLVAMHLGNAYVNFYYDPPKGKGSKADIAKTDIPLTCREAEVASLIMDGLTAKAIGDRLGISRETVYKHIGHIHRKLDVGNHAELAAKLRELFG